MNGEIKQRFKNSLEKFDFPSNAFLNETMNTEKVTYKSKEELKRKRRIYHTCTSRLEAMI